MGWLLSTENQGVAERPKQKGQGESIPVPFIAIKVYEVNYLLFLLYRIFISLSSLDFQFFP